MQPFELITYLKDGGLLVALCYGMFLGSKLFAKGVEALERNTRVLSRIEGKLGIEHESDRKLKGV